MREVLKGSGAEKLAATCDVGSGLEGDIVGNMDGVLMAGLCEHLFADADGDRSLLDLKAVDSWTRENGCCA